MSERRYQKAFAVQPVSTAEGGSPCNPMIFRSSSEVGPYDFAILRSPGRDNGCGGSGGHVAAGLVLAHRIRPGFDVWRRLGATRILRGPQDAAKIKRSGRWEARWCRGPGRRPGGPGAAPGGGLVDDEGLGGEGLAVRRRRRGLDAEDSERSCRERGRYGPTKVRSGRGRGSS
jgi:hypothetical protein